MFRKQRRTDKSNKINVDHFVVSGDFYFIYTATKADIFTEVCRPVSFLYLPALKRFKYSILATFLASLQQLLYIKFVLV